MLRFKTGPVHVFLIYTQNVAPSFETADPLVESARAIACFLWSPRHGHSTAIFSTGFCFENMLWLVVTGFHGFMDFMTFHSVWNNMECHHPSWRTPSFFRRVGIPPISASLCVFTLTLRVLSGCFHWWHWEKKPPGCRPLLEWFSWYHMCPLGWPPFFGAQIRSKETSGVRQKDSCIETCLFFDIPKRVKSWIGQNLEIPLQSRHECNVMVWWHLINLEMHVIEWHGLMSSVRG
jgi:hypothetical protein